MRMRRRSSSRASGIFWNIPLTNAFTTAAGSDGDNLLPLTVGLFDKRSIDYNLQYKVIEVLVGEVLDSINPDKFQVMKRSLLYGHGETDPACKLEIVLEFERLLNWKPNEAELYQSKREQHPESGTLGAFPATRK
ncbi:hypothetical protein Ct61P_15480 [Colletotrichum tofieldiae]|nr:hypothetical protein Ct61P_15480 [Colletotrichum tofieldiae]